MYLSGKASRARLREAENAQQNRREILKAWSTGQVSRRDLIKMGLFTVAGTIVMKNGLSPFARSAYAFGSSIPTGLPPSPLFGASPFTQPMPRFDVLPRNAVSTLNPAPTEQANTTQQLLNTALEGVKAGDTGPIEGRPPGAIWAHQGFSTFSTQIAIEVTELGARTLQSRGAVEPQFGHQPRERNPPALPPGFSEPGAARGLDLQRDCAAQAGPDPLRRARPVS
jgi:hypothetical protein